MMIGIVGPMTSCMKVQGICTKFNAKYNKKETLHSIILQEEETSTLVVDLEEEDEEEVWAELEAKSFFITPHNQDIWQGISRILVPLAFTTTHLSMSLKIVLHC
jgi:hypothetical protein